MPVYLCVCVFACLCICVFLCICNCVFVYVVQNSKRACRREGQGTDDGPSQPAVWQELAGLLSAQEHPRKTAPDRGDGCPVRS